MADVKIVDIDSEQWNMKDQNARDRIAVLETKTVVTENVLWSRTREYIKIVTINGKRFLSYSFKGLFEITQVVQTHLSLGSALNPTDTLYILGNGDYKDSSGRIPVTLGFDSEGHFFTVAILPNQSTGSIKAARLYANGFVNMD